jgi:hypothetical protein
MTPELPNDGGTLTVKPIGFVQAEARTRVEAPRQPPAAAGI